MLTFDFDLFHLGLILILKGGRSESGGGLAEVAMMNFCRWRMAADRTEEGRTEEGWEGRFRLFCFCL